MLMASRFISYCSICGRPIYDGDLFDYKDKQANCVCCYLKAPKPVVCKHTALKITKTQLRSSKRHAAHGCPGPHDGEYECRICGAYLKDLPRELVYIKWVVIDFYGHAPGYGLDVDTELRDNRFPGQHEYETECTAALILIALDITLPGKVREIAMKQMERINGVNHAI